LKLSKTRYAYIYIYIYSVGKNFKSLSYFGKKWLFAMRDEHGRIVEVRDFKHLVLVDCFWNNVESIVKNLELFCIILHLVDM